MSEEYATSEDIDRMTRNIKAHIDDKLSPIIDNIRNHDIVLHGATKTDGLIGDVRDMKNASKVIKWLASLGGSGGILAGLSAFFKNGS